MKKWMKALVVALSALLCLTSFGCRDFKKGNEEDVKYTVNFDIPASTEGSLKVIIPDNEPERKKMNALIQGFNQLYPQVTVKLNMLDIDSYNSTITKQSQAGILADIIWANSSNYYFLISNNVALSLNQFVEQAKNAGVFNYDADFTEDFKKMGKLGDRLYTVARSTDSIVTFYNKEIMAAAKVDTSVFQNGWTWDDFLGVCEKVRKYFDGRGETNYYPIDANLNWESIAYPIIKSLGGEVIGADGKFALTEETSNKIVALVKNLVDKRYIPAKNDAASNFESGTGAMLFQSAAIDIYESTALLKGKFDVVSFPLISGENSCIGYGLAGYSINSAVLKDQQKLDLSCAFMSYLMSFEGQQKIAKDGGLTLPSIRVDLGVDNAEANWHSTYKNFNIEAYTYGQTYKMDMGFLSNTKAIFATDIINSIKSYVGAYAIRENAAKAYQLFKGEVEDVFASVVE